MAFDLKSWLTGFALGLAGKPCPLPQGEPTQPDEPVAPPTEPVAYLYNGVRLPKLPLWDTSTYPYAYISYQPKYRHYSVDCSTTPAYYEPNGAWGPCFSIRNPSIGCGLFTDWSNWLTFDNDGGFLIGMESPDEDDTTLVWCNHDVTYDDGTVFLAASDPVPVYE